MMTGCDPSFWQWLNDAGRDGGQDGAVDAAVEAGGPSCGNEAMLDVDYDKSLGIDCNSVRAALAQRRGAEVTAELDRRAAAMRSSFRRCCVSREQLVVHRRPWQQQESSNDPEDLSKNKLAKLSELWNL